MNSHKKRSNCYFPGFFLLSQTATISKRYQHVICRNYQSIQWRSWRGIMEAIILTFNHIIRAFNIRRGERKQFTITEKFCNRRVIVETVVKQHSTHDAPAHKKFILRFLRRLPSMINVHNIFLSSTFPQQIFHGKVFRIRNSDIQDNKMAEQRVSRIYRHFTSRCTACHKIGKFTTRPASNQRFQPLNLISTNFNPTLYVIRVCSNRNPIKIASEYNPSVVLVHSTLIFNVNWEKFRQKGFPSFRFRSRVKRNWSMKISSHQKLSVLIFPFSIEKTLSRLARELMNITKENEQGKEDGVFFDQDFGSDFWLVIFRFLLKPTAVAVCKTWFEHLTQRRLSRCSDFCRSKYWLLSRFNFQCTCALHHCWSFPPAILVDNQRKQIFRATG